MRDQISAVNETLSTKTVPPFGSLNSEELNLRKIARVAWRIIMVYKDSPSIDIYYVIKPLVLDY